MSSHSVISMNNYLLCVRAKVEIIFYSTVFNSVLMVEIPSPKENARLENNKFGFVIDRTVDRYQRFDH